MITTLISIAFFISILFVITIFGLNYILNNTSKRGNDTPTERRVGRSSRPPKLKWV